MKNIRLDPSQLYKPCSVEQLKFDSTEELEDIDAYSSESCHPVHGKAAT